jgi:two-component system, chemotaxis family, response regulator PixG
MARILIVEDDTDLVETYTDLLEAHNHSVVSTRYARDAITLVTRVKPQIVILDLNLAGVSGVIVINMIRSYLPLRDTKIIIATGFPEMIQRQSEASRVNLILSKPIPNEQLLEAVNSFTTPTAV